MWSIIKAGHWFSEENREEYKKGKVKSLTFIHSERLWSLLCKSGRDIQWNLKLHNVACGHNQK